MPYMKPRQNDRKIFLVNLSALADSGARGASQSHFLRVLQQDCSLRLVKSRLYQDPPTAQVPNIGDGFKEFHYEAIGVRKVALQGRQPSPQENI